MTMNTLLLLATAAFLCSPASGKVGEQQTFQQAVVEPVRELQEGERRSSWCSNYQSCLDVGRDTGFCCPTVRGPSRSCCPEDILPPQGNCAANPECVDRDYVGECCPSPQIGAFLACCDDAPEEGSCTDNTACYEEGLRGECCPNSLGIYLSCCDINSTPGTCDSNQACADLGLTGDCCPTAQDGITLACCDDYTNEIEGTCADNSYCSALGLQGECCPTAPTDGSEPKFLDCCDVNNPPTLSPSDEPSSIPSLPVDDASTTDVGGEGSSPTVPENIGVSSTLDAQCSAHQQCQETDPPLVGDCCPTADGEYLDCCLMDFEDVEPQALCENNGQCSDLVGICCPTAIDVYLDCCPQVDEVDFDGIVTTQYSLSEIGYDEYLQSRSGAGAVALSLLSVLLVAVPVMLI